MNKNLKTLIIAGFALTLGLVSANATFADSDFNRPVPPKHFEGKDFPPLPPGEHIKKHRPPSHEAFENRLKLTDEQKALARAQREASREKIKPIIDEIKTKKAEIEAVKKTKLMQADIDERVAALEAEIRELRKQAHEVRKDNMKAFESILTDDQKTELKKMKKEGRKKFEKARKAHKKQMKK